MSTVFWRLARDWKGFRLDRTRLPAWQDVCERPIAHRGAAQQKSVISRNCNASHEKAVHHVDKTLNGAVPAQLPIEQPVVFDLALNLKMAASLGITFQRVSSLALRG